MTQVPKEVDRTASWELRNQLFQVLCKTMLSNTKPLGEPRSLQ